MTERFSSELVQTENGFWTMQRKPNADALAQYYKQKYYQNQLGSYAHTYSDEELSNIKKRLELKYAVIEKFMPNAASTRFLDIGAGEGFSLDFFRRMGWDVAGIDFSEWGCQHQNPHVLPYLRAGNIAEEIQVLREGSEVFDLIWLDNVLEHLVEPRQALIDFRELSTSSSMLVIEVPNDFSSLQTFFLNRNLISEKYWVKCPDHVSYFTLESLKSLCASVGWECVYELADFPIEFFIANPNSNYVENRETGAGAHAARVLLDNFILNNREQALEFYRALAKTGLGRCITCFFKKK